MNIKRILEAKLRQVATQFSAVSITGPRPSCYFWRDKSDFEIDCIIEQKGTITPLEIKASQSADIQALNKIEPWNTLTDTQPANNVLVYGGDRNWDTDKGHIVGWRSLGSLLN